jgi:hypothetical protein
VLRPVFYEGPLFPYFSRKGYGTGAQKTIRPAGAFFSTSTVRLHFGPGDKSDSGVR